MDDHQFWLNVGFIAVGLVLYIRMRTKERIATLEGQVFKLQEDFRLLVTMRVNVLEERAKDREWLINKPQEPDRQAGKGQQVRQVHPQ